MATGPTLSLDLTRVQFGSAPVAVFGALSLTVAAGEVVALIGPSGVGKTTLLRMIAGLERRYVGRIAVGGLPPDLAPPPGYVFQDARLLPWLDAAANIRAVRPDFSPPEVDAVLARVGLAGQAAAYPRQLSGGMQRRLGLARALSVGSGLLLLDEPFVSLDRAVVRDLMAVFRAIFAADNPTVVLVSHDVEDAAQLADRVVILAGRPARIAADFRLERTGAEGEAALRLAAIRKAQDDALA